MADQARLYLEKGEELCKYKSSPFSSPLIEEIKNIYVKSRSLLELRYMADTPLIYASREGLYYMVRGFIECAKQSNTNLHTGEIGQLQEFLWVRNRLGQTALDAAIENNHVMIAMLLLENASLECLLSERNHKKVLPVSMLSDPKHDEFIFDILLAAKRREVNAPASRSVLIDHKQEPVYTESIMDPNSYNMSDTSEALQKLKDGELELTPNKNTILHLVTMYGNVKCAKKILENHPSLIYLRNSEGETPAYVAARDGHVDILEIMMQHFKSKNDDIEFLVTRNTDKHNALHIAIQNHHPGVVFWLVMEIPQLANRMNDFEESALYNAAERGYRYILKLILDECDDKAFGGPNGRTSLHGAAISGSPGCIEKLVNEDIKLLYIQDKHGWSALHYAVHNNNFSTTKKLLEADPSIGYEIMKEDDMNTSAIHIAASQGNRRIIELFMSKCRGYSELTDGKGRNILHVAVESKKTEVIEFIFKNESLATLINQKDNNGNTPIHLFMASDVETMDAILDPRVNFNMLNDEKMTPLDVAYSDAKRKMLLQAMTVENIKTRMQTQESSPNITDRDLNENQSEKDRFFRLGDCVALVATLIATATFAATFAVPGGFDGNEGPTQGMPILSKKAAYKAFVVANVLAFSCSCSVLFGYIKLQCYTIHYDHTTRKQKDGFYHLLSLQILLTGIAMVAMAVAFVAGSYVILTPSLGFAISLCTTSLIIMVSMSVFPRKHLAFATLLITRIVDHHTSSEDIPFPITDY